MTEESLMRMSKILQAYQVYFRKLAFEQLPNLADKYLGSAGFKLVVEALADATVAAIPGLLEATKNLVEVPQGDILKMLEVHLHCHTAARKITGDESIGLFIPKRVSEKRLELFAEECPFDANELQLASFVGIVVGVIRALGGKANGIRNESSKRHLPAGSYAVWAVKQGKSCRIIVEEVG